MQLGSKPNELLVLLTLNMAILLWGFSGLFGKWVDVNALNLTFWRMSIAWAALAVFYMLRKRSFKGLGDRSLIWKNILCGILLAVHWFCFFKVIQLSTVAMGIVFSASFVFMVAVLEPILLKIKPNPFIIATALVGSSVLIITMSLQAEAGDPIIWFYGILTAACLAAISLFTRGVMVDTDPVDCITAQLFYGSVALALLALVGSDFNLGWLSDMNFKKVILLGVLTTAVGHTIYFWSLRYVTATKAAILVLLEPAYSIFFAMIMFDEYPSQAMIIGATVVIACAAVVGLFSTISIDKAKDAKDFNP